MKHRISIRDGYRRRGGRGRRSRADRAVVARRRRVGEPGRAERTVTRIGRPAAGGSVTRARTSPGRRAAAARSSASTVARRRAPPAWRASEPPARPPGSVASRHRGRYGGDPQRIAAGIAASQYGWGADQFSCLDSLWARESGWDVHAQNPSSGAYGIPQALPGSKMGAYGSDWADNPTTQIQWGLAYITAATARRAVPGRRSSPRAGTDRLDPRSPGASTASCGSRVLEWRACRSELAAPSGRSAARVRGASCAGRRGPRRAAPR